MNKKKIIVADDDPAICEGIAMVLEDEGYQVAITTDGQTVTEAHNHLPDLILLDIWMSGIDGRDICKKLKAQGRTKHIPIIMISANRDTAEIAKKAGAEDYLSKPFEINNLIEKV